MIAVPADRGSRLRGFTIVEMLIVIAIVIVLLSTLIVAVQAATRTAQNTNTRSLMAAISQALVRFEGDVGYLPPVLAPGSAPLNNADEFRRLWDPRDVADPTDTNVYRDEIQQWYSITTLAEYLVGYGNHRQDGYGAVPGGWTTETPPVGIRHPGPDGVWGAAAGGGALAYRMGGPNYGSTTAPYPFDQGRVYGPYLELREDRLLASVSGFDSNGKPVISLPGERSYNPTHPKVVCDYWGEPIRYYRRLYAPGAIQARYQVPVGSSIASPSLADVFLLRPFEVKEGAAIDSLRANGNPWLPDKMGDTTITHALRAADFAIFSSGADRAFDETVRYDGDDALGNGDGIDFSNEDNIVELAP